MMSSVHAITFGAVLGTEVGDRVRVLKHFSNDAAKVKVRNLRTGGEGLISWDAVREVSSRSTCACFGSQCRCVYEYFVASMAYKKLVKEKEPERVRFQMREMDEMEGKLGVCSTREPRE